MGDVINELPLPARIPKRVETCDGLREAVEKGLPAGSVGETLAVLQEAARKAVGRSLDLGGARVLSRASGERLQRVARVIALARATYANDDAGAVSFLVTPNRSLGKAAPVEPALSEIGARQVGDLFVRMAYGFPNPRCGQEAGRVRRFASCRRVEPRASKPRPPLRGAAGRKTIETVREKSKKAARL